ncbi:hypothetical protein QW180_18765 [Vibrio sinaloensis]|nr:hypothetical protein [Vibrio sinaloensis]
MDTSQSSISKKMAWLEKNRSVSLYCIERLVKSC